MAQEETHNFAQQLPLMHDLLTRSRTIISEGHSGESAPSDTVPSLRTIAETLEEFAADIGMTSAYLRLCMSAAEPSLLAKEWKKIEKICSHYSEEKLQTIARFMDRNFVGALDHERGAVVSGRYVGAIPRIKDALSLLQETLDRAQAVADDPQAIAKMALVTDWEEEEDTPRASALDPDEVQAFLEWKKQGQAAPQLGSEISLESLCTQLQLLEKKYNTWPKEDANYAQAEEKAIKLSVFRETFQELFSLASEGGK